MPHECGCGDKNLAMAPWSVGKYAKRMATLHLGSEDQLLLNASTNTVVHDDVTFAFADTGATVNAALRVDLTQAQVDTIHADD
eukprot:COSAG01_NODE_3024_length_6708_cov_23.565138_5_plen_83_part_00